MVGRLGRRRLVPLILAVFLTAGVVIVNVAVTLTELVCEQNAAPSRTDINSQVLPSGDNVEELAAVILLGKPRTEKAFLALGIPTVQRPGGNYLAQTLDSLFVNTRGRHDVVIVLLLADSDVRFRERLADVIAHYYGQYIEEGILEVIALPGQYPHLDDLERTFNDSEIRVKWRSKQALDFSLLMKYGETLADYYLQLEDDVISAPAFPDQIQRFISVQKSQWVCLEFSRLGFIGKLYRSSTLRRLRKFILLFYTKQPVDFLFLYFNTLNVQSKRIFHEPSLFQHIGVHSSLMNKTQPLTDTHFSSWPKQHVGDNPEANLFTDMSIYESWTPELAYSPHPGYFWARTPATGNWLVVRFAQAQRLRRIVIETGAPSDGRDRLQNGKLEAGSDPNLLTPPFCTDYVYVGSFSDGRIDVDAMFSRLDTEIFCLRVTITDSQKSWVIFREIAVFLLS